MNNWSILVPIYNEEDLLNSFCNELLREIQDLDIQVVLTDGGSQDGSSKIAQAFCKNKPNWHFTSITHSSSSIGEASQLGARQVSSDGVLILPCDCMLSHIALKDFLKETFSNSSWGGFIKVYYPTSLLLHLYSKLMNFTLARRKELVWTNGIFLSRRAFLDWPCPQEAFLQDVALSNFLKSSEYFHLLKTPIRVSSRKYLARGAFRQIFTNALIFFCYKLNLVSVKTLKKIYAR